jgi:hypothetical protein
MLRLEPRAPVCGVGISNVGDAAINRNPQVETWTASASPSAAFHDPLSFGLPDDGCGLVWLDFRQRRLVAAVVAVNLEEAPQRVLASRGDYLDISLVGR